MMAPPVTLQVPAAALPAPPMEEVLRLAPLLLFLVIYGILLVVIFRAQRKARKALFDFAAELGWSSLRKPHLSNDAVRGMWNGREAALGWLPASKSSPARVYALVEADRPGSFEIRSRPRRAAFFATPRRIFGPPQIELFDPADAARYCAWASDRSIVDGLLGIPGIRAALEANLQEQGVLKLGKGRLEIRRPFTTARARVFGRFAFRGGPDLDRLREVVREEWGLLARLAG